MNVIARILVTAIAVLSLLVVSAAAAAASPVEWEIETVESLLLSPPDAPFFLYTAPQAVCVNDQGVTEFGQDCPDVEWSCPIGITDGALGRYKSDISYSRAQQGFGALDTMCIPGPFTPNPQPPSTPAPVAVSDLPQPPALAFTGAETTVLGYVGAGLLGVGAVSAAIARRHERW